MDEDETTLDEARMRGVEERSAAVDASLRSNDYAGALQEALKNPPLGTSDASIKEANALVVIRTITAVARGLGVDKGMESVVNSLSADQIDTLSKYIYRGLSECGGQDSGLLLKTINLVTKTRGLGTVARVLTDKRTV